LFVWRVVAVQTAVVVNKRIMYCIPLADVYCLYVTSCSRHCPRRCKI